MHLFARSKLILPGALAGHAALASRNDRWTLSMHKATSNTDYDVFVRERSNTPFGISCYQRGHQEYRYPAVGSSIDFSGDPQVKNGGRDAGCCILSHRVVEAGDSKLLRWRSPVHLLGNLFPLLESGRPTSEHSIVEVVLLSEMNRDYTGIRMAVLMLLPMSCCSRSERSMVCSDALLHLIGSLLCGTA